MTFVPSAIDTNRKRIIIASRKSDLARLQAYAVGEALQKHFSELEVEYRFRESLGDINLQDPLWKMPEKGVFTEDFYKDLCEHKVDLVVHSWKDLPVEEKSFTVIAGTLHRADPRDVLLFKKTSHNKSQLQFFSSSPRRIYNLESFFSWSLPWPVAAIKFTSVRGNIQTRVKKLMQSTEIDGLVVAKAALDRLLSATREEFQETKSFLRGVLAELDFQVLPLSENPTAAAQGALAIEVARDRTDILDLVKKINQDEVYHNVSMERLELKKHGGGCHQKIGVTVINKKPFSLFFLRGLTEQGVILNQRKIFTPMAENVFTEEKKSNDYEVHKNLIKILKPLSFELPYVSSGSSIGLLVTKAEAFGNDSDSKVDLKALLSEYMIWTSGLRTWKKLSQLGIWVSGSFESLGEEEAPELETLAPNMQWFKLTHSQGKKSSWAKKIETYEISYEEPENRKLNLQAESYYWSHGELFKKYFEKYPELKNKVHVCGVGSTYKTLCQYVDPIKIQVRI